MRRTIAQWMQRSFQQAPHIALTVEADVGQLESLRQTTYQAFEAQAGHKVTLTALLVRLVAWAVERHPTLKVSLMGESIYLWKEINIGVASAVLDGLTVPVTRQANRKSVGEITADLAEVTAKARQGRLSPQDVQHGTFTLSNLGMFGIRQFQAVINPPESAILAVGAVVRRPAVIDPDDRVAVRPMMALTLSADHRVQDGVLAAKFLDELVRAIESPEAVLSSPSQWQEEST